MLCHLTHPVKPDVVNPDVAESHNAESIAAWTMCLTLVWAMSFVACPMRPATNVKWQMLRWLHEVPKGMMCFGLLVIRLTWLFLFYQAKVNKQKPAWCWIDGVCS
jgi:hypothetical protein